MTSPLNALARQCADTAHAYLTGAGVGHDLLRTRTLAARVTLRDMGLQHEGAPRLAEVLEALLLASERTSESGGTHEIVWRNAMHALAQVVRFYLGERRHPEDAPLDEIAEINRASMARARAKRLMVWDGEKAVPLQPFADEQLRLLLTIAGILRERLPEMAPAYAEGDVAALDEALAPLTVLGAVPLREADRENGHG